MSRSLLLLCAPLLTLSAPSPAQAFPHIVKHNETLAGLAEQMYGAVQLERILVAANGLTGPSATPIVPGMRLEVPAPSHYRVQLGDSFASIAHELLGGGHRAAALAEANHSKPWLPPDPGTQLVVPYNLRVVVTDQDTLTGLAYKFLGDRKQAWALDQYNGLKGNALKRGDTVLIPLIDLPLTEAGKQAAQFAEHRQHSEGDGGKREVQRKVEAELPLLIGDTRGGRYVEAIVRGAQLIGSGELSRAQLAVIHRQLLEAYVALGATGLALESCQRWFSNDPSATLDPVLLSPKIIAACPPPKAEAAPAASSP